MRTDASSSISTISDYIGSVNRPFEGKLYRCTDFFPLWGRIMEIHPFPLAATLQFAESGCDRGIGGADRRQQAADDSHRQRKENSPHEQFGRDLKSKRQARKRLPVDGCRRKAVQRQDGNAAHDSPDKRYQQGFEQERRHHGDGAKAQGAHGGDFAATLGYRGVHGIEPGENGTNGYYGGHHATENGYQPGHLRRLFCVVVNLARHVDVQPRVGRDGILELLEGIGRDQMNGNRLEDVRRALQDLIEDGSVAPDFGIERGATGVEYADHLPGSSAKIDRVSDRQPRICGGRIFADDQLVQTRVEHASLRDFDKVANAQDIGRDSADLHIRVRATADQRKWYDANHFLGDKRTSGISRDSRRILNDFYTVQGDAAHHFGGRTGAHHQRVSRRPGRHQRRAEAPGQREHGDENTHGPRDSNHGNDGRGPAGLDAANIVSERYGHG